MWDGAVLGKLSFDTLKRIDKNGQIIKTESREEIFMAQTPQVAKLQLWREAFTWAKSTGFQATDDVSLLEALGKMVTIIPSPSSNLKLTTPEDWDYAKQKLGL